MLISAASLLTDTGRKGEGLREGTVRLEDHMPFGCAPNQHKRADFPVMKGEPAETSLTQAQGLLITAEVKVKKQRTYWETNTDFFLLGTAWAWWPHLCKSPPSLTLAACEPLGDKAHLSLPQAMTKGLPHLCSGQSWGHIAYSTNKNTKEKLVLVAQVCNPVYIAGWGRRSQSSRFYITWIHLGNSVSKFKKTHWGDKNPQHWRGLSTFEKELSDDLSWVSSYSSLINGQPHANYVTLGTPFTLLGPNFPVCKM